MTGTSPFQVAHLFADYGAESEVLSMMGPVTRYTIDPEPNPFVAETIQMNLMEEMPDKRFDLALLHPKCTDVSQMTSINGSVDDHENQIPRARKIAKAIADDYVIENKPRDDLIDPVQLNGRMFGLPIAYERAFETTFPIRGPPRERSWDEKTVSVYYSSDRSKEWWQMVKGYKHDYPKGHIVKNALPSIYVQTIVRSYLQARNERDGQVPQDSRSGFYRQIPDDQSTLRLIE